MLRSCFHQLHGQLSGKAATLRGWMRADRAELDVAGDAHALSGHGDEAPAFTNAEVGAEQRCPRSERSWLGDSDKLHHLVYVLYRQDIVRRRSVSCDQAFLGNHLQHGKCIDLDPTVRRRLIGEPKQPRLGVGRQSIAMSA